MPLKETSFLPRKVKHFPALSKNRNNIPHHNTTAVWHHTVFGSCHCCCHHSGALFVQRNTFVVPGMKTRRGSDCVSSLPCHWFVATAPSLPEDVFLRSETSSFASWKGEKRLEQSERSIVAKCGPGFVVSFLVLSPDEQDSRWVYILSVMSPTIVPLIEQGVTHCIWKSEDGVRIAVSPCFQSHVK